MTTQAHSRVKIEKKVFALLVCCGFVSLGTITRVIPLAKVSPIRQVFVDVSDEIQVNNDGVETPAEKLNQSNASPGFTFCGRNVPLDPTVDDIARFIGNQLDQMSSLYAGHNLRACDTSRYITIGLRNIGTGRDNNKLIALFHALDSAYGSQRYPIVVTYNWADDLLNHYFDRDAGRLNETLCLVSERDLPKYNATLLEHYVGSSHTGTENVARTRPAMLRRLFSNIRQPHCSLTSKLTEKLDSYTVLHYRWSEGKCVPMMECQQTRQGLNNVESCNMTASYVKGIMAQADMLDKPLLVIHDAQRPEVVDRLLQDERIGPQVTIVPSENLPGEMMLAILANYFIGMASSTVSGNIARARLALGWDEGSNFVYLKDNVWNSTRTWDICTKCAYSQSSEVPPWCGWGHTQPNTYH